MKNEYDFDKIMDEFYKLSEEDKKVKSIKKEQTIRIFLKFQSLQS